MDKLFDIFVFIFITLITIIVSYNIYLGVENNQIPTGSTNQKVVKNSTKIIENISKVESNISNNISTTRDNILIEEVISSDYDLALSLSLSERLSQLGAFRGEPIFIRLFKEEKELEIWIKPKASLKFKLLKRYPICSYSGKLGPKLKEGDKQAPEGFYRVKKSSLNPNSSYHLSFNLGFPNRYDRANGRTGSYLMIHGNCVSIGCYAMGDRNIEDIYTLVDYALSGNKKFVDVHIFPFKMELLEHHKKSKWYKFWLNLKEGYMLFEKSHNPPRVKVKNRRYIFI